MLEDISALENCTVSSVPDGYDAFLLASLWEKSKHDILYIVSDGVALENTAHILSVVRPEAEVLKFPAWDTVPYDRVSPNVNITAARVNVLSALAQQPNPKKPRIIIASAGAAIQRLPLKKIFLNSMKNIRVGGELNFNDFVHYAVVNGYNRVEQVMEPGEYAVRGDILDIFPVGSELPLRVDLFGDEVEKIRTFDPLTQRTAGELKSYTFQVMGEVALDNNTVKTFRAKYREAFGAGGTTDELYETISSGQKYMGMENWLPFFYDETLPTLFDYLPQAYVTVGRNVREAVKSKEESIADYYQARLEEIGRASCRERV